jgi:ribonuclease HI
VAKEDYCETCGMAEEPLFHVAFKCSYALHFWQAARKVTGCKVPVLNERTWTHDLMLGELCLEKEMVLVICGIWSLWSGRNVRRRGKEKWNAMATVRHVSAMVEELMCLESGSATNLSRAQIKWKKPNHGWCKVNTDGAFHASSCTSAGGVVIRDADGQLMTVAARRYQYVAYALMAEALAARDGLKLAEAHGVERVILEIDSLEMYNLLQSCLGERSAVAGLWQEIRELGRSFSSFKLSFVYREGNEAAHLCASLVSESNLKVVWITVFPPRLM